MGEPIDSEAYGTLEPSPIVPASGIGLPTKLEEPDSPSVDQTTNAETSSNSFLTRLCYNLNNTISTEKSLSFKKANKKRIQLI